MHTALPLSHEQLLRLTNAVANKLRVHDPEHELLRFAVAIEAGTQLEGELLKEFMDRFGHDTVPKTVHALWLSYYRRLEAVVSALPPQLPAAYTAPPVPAVVTRGDGDRQPTLWIVPDPTDDPPAAT